MKEGGLSEVNHQMDDVHRWMVPLPGGFHIYKQGIIPLSKEFMCGSGIEEFPGIFWLVCLAEKSLSAIWSISTK